MCSAFSPISVAKLFVLLAKTNLSLGNSHSLHLFKAISPAILSY